MFHVEQMRIRTRRLGQGGVPRSGGAVGSRNPSLNQHHLGTPRHPSSVEEGSSRRLIRLGPQAARLQNVPRGTS